MRKVFALFSLFICAASQAQDERFYRNIFDGTFGSSSNKEFVFKYEVRSPKYMIDLNRDGIVDSFQTVKKDGIDFIRINDANGVKVFEKRLHAKGKNSSIIKAHLVSISPAADALILHYYEGDHDNAIFEGSARLYVLTIRDRNLNKISFSKGPHFWTERESSSPHYQKYWARRFVVNTLDYNGDGIKEISVSFNKIHRILQYTKAGVWELF